MIEFKDHIVEYETIEKSLENCLVTVLISIKPESKNKILGYRCKYPKCYYIELTLDDAYEHVKIYHKIDRPFLCESCKAVFEDTNQLLLHKKYDHNDNLNKSDKQHNIRFECINRNIFTNIMHSTSKDICSNKRQNVVKPMKDNDDIQFVQMRSMGEVLRNGCELRKFNYSNIKKIFDYNHVKHHLEVKALVDVDYDKQFSSHKKLNRYRNNRHDSRYRKADIRKKSERKSEVRKSDIIEKRQDNRKISDKNKSFKNHYIGIETFDKIENNGLLAYVFSKKQDFNARNVHCRCLGYRCLYPGCEFINAYRTAVDKHITDKHSLYCGKHYKCALCDYVFNSELERDGHLVEKHNSSINNEEAYNISVSEKTDE